MALSFKVKAISRSRFLKNFFLSFIFLLSFLLILFSKSDYFIISKLKSISNTYLHPITTFIVAPVKIEKKSVVGAGSVITRDVKENSLALERSEQEEIENYKRKK